MVQEVVEALIRAAAREIVTPSTHTEYPRALWWGPWIFIAAWEVAHGGS